MWYIVKGRGGYRLEPKAHWLTDEAGVGRTLRSHCGHFLVPISPMTTEAVKTHAEVQCKKCVRIV